MLNWLSNDTQIEQILWGQPISTTALLVFFAVALIFSVFVYRRRSTAPTWVRVALAASRLLTLCLLVAVLFEPTATISQTRRVERRLPVLVDVSESMSIRDQRKRPEDVAEAADAFGFLSSPRDANANQALMSLDAKQRQTIASASRLDLATRLLSQSARSVFESVGEDFDVSYHAFGNKTRVIGDDSVLSSETISALKAAEHKTSITESLEAVANAGGAPPAGIVLLSDGIDNTSSRRSDSVLLDLGTRGIPVYTVPIGLTDPDDVSIRNIVMQEVAYSGDRVPVRVQLQSKGYEKRTARLTLHLNGRRISQRTVRFAGGLQFEDIDFRVDVYKKGAVQIAVAIEPFDDEVSVANNRIERSIRVVNEKVSVLYIEGNARWEYRYLRAILKRDPRIDATFIASNVGPEVARNSPDHIERFPRDRKDAFQYDLIILGDVDAAFFNDDELEVLEELIRDRGASLLMLCGPMHSPSSYAGTPVETMLPVAFDPDSPWEEVAESVYPVLTPEGSTSLVMTLENEPEANDRIWSQVAPLDHLPPLLGAKAGATVLAALSDGGSRAQLYPLVAWQRYGSGKCMSVATDRLWRLRFKTGDKYHWRLWSQCMQFMTLSRLMGEDKRIRLETDRAIYTVGSQCRIYAHVLDDNFEPVERPTFDVIVSGLDGVNTKERINLRADRSRPGLYEGYFTPPIAGRYRMESNGDDQAISNTTEFQVADVNLELARTNMQLKRLQQIAELTGGECLSIGDLKTLPALLNHTPHTTTIRSDYSLWDNGWIGFLLIVLMGGEWIVRRRHDLS